MGDTDLLDMLASETDRRSEAIIEGVQALCTSGKADAKRLEELRVEAHGLKGAALVVGQERLAELARFVEQALADCKKSGRIDPALAARVVAATSALHEGAQAAAEGVGEPSSVAESLAELGG
jgi:HPt (histidine-containing phosphotransfer) domain-containing protein